MSPKEEWPGRDPVNAEIRRLVSVLGKELTGRILGALLHEPYLSASEIAGRLNVHIATAQKYLLEMKGAGIVNSRCRIAPTRPTDEYWIVRDHISIEIDLKGAPSIKGDDIEKMASSLFIRGQDAQVALDRDEGRKMISEILVLDGKGQPGVTRRMKLNDMEGRFAWNLPNFSETPVSVMEVARMARIDRAFLPQLLDLVTRLEDIGLVGHVDEKELRGRANRDELKKEDE